MGREARCRCTAGDTTGDVNALLESRELILRGRVKRTIALTSLTHVRAESGALRFEAGGEAYALELGAAVAARWAAKIAEPPPSLARKLGIGPSAKALIVGVVDDDALRAALADAATVLAADARAVIAIVADADELRAALCVHDDAPPGTPIWVIHGKGRDAPFGDGLVRELMRSRGYIDTKVSAVSDARSATRYSKRTAPAAAPGQRR